MPDEQVQWLTKREQELMKLQGFSVDEVYSTPSGEREMSTSDTFVSESEMTQAASIWHKMQDAVIAGSKLAVEFGHLQEEVRKVKLDLEAVRQHNKMLDEHAAIVRSQRDSAQAELVEARAALTQATADLGLTKSMYDASARTIERLQEQLEAAKRERDEAIMNGLRAEEERDDFRKRVEGATRALGILAGAPTPLAAQEEPEASAHVGEPSTDSGLGAEPSVPTVAQTPEPEAPAVTGAEWYATHA
jgi:chromosome segregation ATPase